MNMDSAIRAAGLFEDMAQRSEWIDFLSGRKYAGSGLDAAENAVLERELLKAGIRICSYCGGASRAEKCSWCGAHG